MCIVGKLAMSNQISQATLHLLVKLWFQRDYNSC
jgi:hypothetical protein